MNIEDAARITYEDDIALVKRLSEEQNKPYRGNDTPWRWLLPHEKRECIERTRLNCEWHQINPNDPELTEAELLRRLFLLPNCSL